MTIDVNKWGQPVGPVVERRHAADLLRRVRLRGRYVVLEPLRPADHAKALWQHLGGVAGAKTWTYFFYGPFASFGVFTKWLTVRAHASDAICYAIRPRTATAAEGMICYTSPDRENRSVEIGGVLFGAPLRQTRAATETLYLMLDNSFSRGYRRCEWRCDTLNTDSLRAAERFGFTLDGVFRQAKVRRGRNRDLAWLSVLDSEWPRRAAAYRQWLDEDNFDANGRQRVSLRALMPPVTRPCFRNCAGSQAAADA